MREILILGENSFVGKNLYKYLQGNHVKCQAIPKDSLDFLKENTYSKVKFSNSIIIDFINVNNGIKSDVMNCNYYGFKNFIHYLKNTQQNISYVYVSTISVLSDDAINSSIYVKSKKMAEDELLNSGLDYQIQRLSYPIGIGENKNRLISRLINELKEEKDITVNNILININDVKNVVSGIYSQLLKSKVTFISDNNYIYLADILFLLKEFIRSKSDIKVVEVEDYFTPTSDNPINSSDIRGVLCSMI